MKTFADLAPTDAQWLQIQRLAKGGLDRATVAVLPMLVINSEPTVYFTVPDKTWFAQALADINGDEGVSLQLNHDIETLPCGRLFAAELSEHEGNLSLIAYAYTRDRELVEKYLAGEVQAVSAGLECSYMRCGICGNEWLSRECVRYADDHEQALHWPGEMFDGKVCLLYYVCENGDRALREVSPVYCGASAGRLLDSDAAMKIAGGGLLYAEASALLAHADKELTKEQCAKAAEKFKQCAATLVLPAPVARAAATDPVVAPLHGASANVDGLSRPSAVVVALDDALAANANLTAENAALTKAVADINADLGAALDAARKAKEHAATLDVALAEKDAALAAAAAQADTVDAKIATAALPLKASLRDNANADDALAALAAAAQAFVALRAFLHEQAAMYCVKAHGNAAAPPDIAALQAADPIIAAFSSARDEFTTVHKMPPLTAPTKPAREPVKRSPAAFRMRKLS